METLVDLERRGWAALATGREAAIAFYRQVLDPKAVMLMPGGLMFDGRDAILDAIGDQACEQFEIDRPGVRALDRGGRIIVYRVRAERDAATYRAWASSADTWSGSRWLLVCHQQTRI